MGALADTLVSRGGYNRIDAENAERGPRAGELTREFLGGGGGGGGNNGGGGNVIETAKQLLGFQQQANQPAIQSLQAQAGEVGQSFAGQRERLAGGIQALKDRYNQILDEMKGRVSTDLSREYGRRGIPLSSGMFEQDLTSKINPLTRDVGLAREEGVRGIEQLIAGLTGQETETKRNILNAIAQLQAGAPGESISQALNLISQQQTAQQATAKAREPISLSEGTTLFDPTTGKPIYTAPKTYKPGDGGGLPTPTLTTLQAQLRPQSPRSPQTNRPRLYDPSSGEIYEYDGWNDPEYRSDVTKGFNPA